MSRRNAERGGSSPSEKTRGNFKITMEFLDANNELLQRAIASYGLLATLSTISEESGAQSFIYRKSATESSTTRSPEVIPPTFLQGLKERRLAAKLSQEEVAKRACISTIYVRKIESGRANPTSRVLSAIDHVLNQALSQ